MYVHAAWAINIKLPLMGLNGIGQCEYLNSIRPLSHIPARVKTPNIINS